MSYDFHVGMKVVCVGMSGAGGYRNETIGQKGAIYTLRDVGVNLAGEKVVRLKEIINAPQFYQDTVNGGHRRMEIWFMAKCFRPLESKAIEHFRAIAQGVTDGRPIIKDPMPLKEVLV